MLDKCNIIHAQSWKWPEIEWIIANAVDIIGLADLIAEDPMFTWILTCIMLTWMELFLWGVRYQVDAGFLAQKAARTSFNCY